MTASGIVVVGLNGCGKTTLGRALARELGAFRMDVEDYFFPPTDAVPFTVSRTNAEARLGILADVSAHPRFVLSLVNGNWCEGLADHLRCAIFLSAPWETRRGRIDARERLRFGDRVLPGGDMYEQQRAFRAHVAGRTEAPIEDWLVTNALPSLRLDARRSIEENTARAVAFCRAQGL